MKLLVFLFIFVIFAKEDYYKTLGLQKGVDIDTVKKQFRKLSLKYHPDKNKSPGADQKYKQITHAYQQIVDGKADEDEELQFQRNNQNFYSRTYTFQDDPFSRRTYYQSYHYSSQPKESESFYFNTFIIILMIVFGIFLINFASSNNQQQEEQQNNQNTNNNQYNRPTSATSQNNTKQPSNLPKDIQEKVSNISSYTESNHRFSFYENYNQ